MSDPRRHVLFISYNGTSNPLTHTQVLPYLEALTSQELCFSLLTYEAIGDDSDVALAAERLRAADITWHPLRYHKRPSLVATAWDVVAGCLRAALIHLSQQRLDATHARGYVPGVVSLTLKRIFGIPFIFDMRGLMADEYVDAGNWRAGGLNYRLAKRAEQALLRSADEVIVLTERIRDHLLAVSPFREFGLERRITVIPCCVDIDRAADGASYRMATRSALQLEDRFVVVYSGSVGTWYLLSEMLAFYARLRRAVAHAHLLVLNRAEHAMIRASAEASGVSPEALTVLALAPADVPRYLGAADVGLFFIKPSFAKSASSPTKLGEYLAAGLPVIVNSGVGDVDALVRAARLGVVVEDLGDVGYEHAVADVLRLAEMLSGPAGPELRARSRAAAEAHLSLQLGVARYRDVYARLGR